MATDTDPSLPPHFLADKQPQLTEVAQLLNRITRRILNAPDLDHTLAVTAAEVRDFLQVDRVKIYQFHSNGDGQVIAESIDQDRLPSLLGLNFPADDIPPEARELFMRARMRSIVNVADSQIGQGFLVDPNTGETLPESLQFRPVDPCHQEYLTAMGVQSSLVVPICHGGALWGLLVAHHAQAWSAAAEVVEGMQMVVDQLSVAIAQADLWQQANIKAQREAQINQISQRLYPSDQMDLPTALADAVTALQGCGGRLYVDEAALIRQLHPGTISPEPETGPETAPDQVPSPLIVLTHGTQPQSSGAEVVMERSQTWQRYFQPPAQSREAAAPWTITDLHRVAALRNIQPNFRGTKVRGLLVVPLSLGATVFGYLSVFRNEIETETLWAGQIDGDRRQDQPRLSFEVWCESKQGQADPWTENDQLLATALGQQFATAIQQQVLQTQLQRLNNQLEQQVCDRTAKLQNALKSLQNTQSQLVQAEKMSSLGQLVASVAHEVNNPINFIGGNLNHARDYLEDVLSLIGPEVAAADNGDDIDIEFIREDFPRLFASMHTGVERIQQVVQSLLNFSRHGQAELKVVNLHEGLDSTLLILHYRMKSRADAPGITVQKQYGDLPLVSCYASHLNQVFMNILGNAVQAIEQRWLAAPNAMTPGQIEIETLALPEAESGPGVKIRISDNGCGISPDVKAHVFEPFFTTKTMGQGTGLGLSICRQIVVDQHGGQITCESTPGEGTTFWIHLPIQAPEGS
jgi:light-regulated signal transduction histidine kinase (bacteriophytochrome)